MENSYSWLVRRSSPRVVVIAYAATVVVIVAYLIYVRDLDAMIANSTYLDLRTNGYNAGDVNELFAELGSEGRSLYTRTTLGDTIWPLLFGISGALAAPLAFQRRWIVLLTAFLPMAFAIIDLVENIGLWTMLGTYPDISTTVVSVTSALTQTKWLLIIPPAFIAWIALPIIAIARHLRAGQQVTNPGSQLRETL